MRRLASTLLATLLASTLAPALEAQRPIPLDTVHVSAGSRVIAGAASVTRSVDVLDRATIEMLPARSVTDVIARALGADLLARSPAQADLAIRGSSFEQVLVLIDGVPVNDSQTGHFHLDIAVPLDAVERIEVLRGPASAIYGSSAVGGVVNVVTRRGTPELTARAQAGSFGAYAFGAEAAVGGGARPGVRLGADHDVSDGHRPGTDHRTTQARFGLDAPLARGTLHAAAAWAARDFGASEFYAPFDSYEETRTATASAAWRSRPAALVIEPRVSFRQHEDDFILRRDDPSFYRNQHTTRQTGAELVARRQMSARLALALGGEGARSSIESNSLGERVETRVAGFAEAAAGDPAAALLTLGLRLDDNSSFGAFLSSSAAASYRISPAWRLRASAANGFRPPSWTDRYYEDPANVGNPDLDAERFWTAEIGAAVNRGAVTADLAAFIRRARDLIDWGRPAGEPETTPWRTLNVESATFHGLEAMTRLDIRGIHLTGRASLLSFDAEESSGFVSKYALRPLTRSASLDIAVPVTVNGTFALRGMAARRADGAMWELVDARVSVRAFGLHIFADATNLLDESYLDVSGVEAPGRAFAVGARMRR